MLRDDIETIRLLICRCDPSQAELDSWERIKTELVELGTSPNNESVPSGRFLTKDDWPLKRESSLLDRYLPDETAHIS